MKKGVDLLFYLNFAWYSGKTCFPKIGKHAFINKWKLNKTERGEGGVVILWLKWPPPLQFPPPPLQRATRVACWRGGGEREGGATPLSSQLHCPAGNAVYERGGGAWMY
nr:hypothetical protein [Morchella crassipes]